MPELVNVGTLPNDGTGDVLRDAFVKSNDWFAYLEDISGGAAFGGGLLGFDSIDELSDYGWPVVGGVESVASYSALRSKVSTDPQIVVDALTANDNAGGVFTVKTGGTDADNGGTMIVANDGTRWERSNFVEVNARWFGAKGDGVTDDSAALQKAIDYCMTTKFGLYIPKGDYRVVSQLVIDTSSLNAHVPGIHIRGDGDWEGGTVIVSEVLDYVLKWTGQYAGLYRFQYGSSMRDIKFRPKRQNWTPGTDVDPVHTRLAGTKGLYMRSLWHSRWINVTTDEFAGNGWTYEASADGDSSANTLFEGCKSQYNGGYGWEFTGGSGGLTLGRMINCYASRNGEYQLGMDGCIHWIIESCSITGQDRAAEWSEGPGIFLKRVSGTNRDIEIRGCELGNNLDTYTIRIDAISQCTIRHNRILRRDSEPLNRFGVWINDKTAMVNDSLVATVSGVVIEDNNLQIDESAANPTYTFVRIGDALVGSNNGLLGLRVGEQNIASFSNAQMYAFTDNVIPNNVRMELFERDGYRWPQKPKVHTATTGSGSYTPNWSNGIVHYVTNTASSFTIANPIGLRGDMNGQIFRFIIKNTGTANSISFGTQYITGANTMIQNDYLAVDFLYDQAADKYVQITSYTAS